MLKLKLQYFGHLMGRVDSLGKTLMLGGIGGKRRRGWQRMRWLDWHHWLDGCESQWTPGVGDGRGGLACCNSWGRKESDMTEGLNWTELNLQCLSNALAKWQDRKDIQICSWYVNCFSLWSKKCEFWYEDSENGLFFLMLSLYFLFKTIYWNVVSQCCVSFRYTIKWLSYTHISLYIYTHIYILFSILFYYRLVQEIEHSSLCYAIGSYWLSI